TLNQGIREFDKMFSRMTETLSVFHDMQQKLGAALVESGALRKLHDAQETAENVGSSLRPTPEMQQMAGEIKKFSDAVRVIEEFADKSQAFISAMGTVGGREAFKLYDTFGFPIEMTTEMAGERGLEVDLQDFEERFKKHQELSHAGAEQRFKGGLADAGEQT